MHPKFMYSPIRDGIDKTVRSVRYTEVRVPSHLGRLVHCFWELKTEDVLSEDFYLHALPDACINILFNQIDPEIAGVTALRTKYEVLNLGRFFHYVGIQFFPGVWQGDRAELMDRFVGTPYLGQLPLIETSLQLAEFDFVGKQLILARLVQRLIAEGLVVGNIITEKILTNLEQIQSVADMAALTRISPRQLQRVLKQSTGFTPHDLLKVLRLQKTFGRHYLEGYSDQAHFIHSFRKITGYTPTRYYNKFDV